MTYEIKIILVAIGSWSALMAMVAMFGIIIHQRLKEYRDDDTSIG